MYGARLAAFGVLVLALPAASAYAQAQITVSNEVNLRFGVLGQFQADWLEDPVADDTQQNLFIRRVRLLFGGQIAPRLTFFIETDAANLGRRLPGGKNISPQMIIQDAYASLALHDALTVDLGLMFVPFGRNNVQSAATLLPIDYGAYTFAASAATESVVGRDTGVQARGYVLGNRLEYRLGAFQGARDPGAHRAFRYAGRVQVQLLDPEPVAFFYAGTHLGARRTAAIGAAFDHQEDYAAFDVDLFVDHPLGPGAITSQLAYQSLDGDTTFPALPRQNVVLFELGYFVRALRISPVLQFTRRDLADRSAGDETRWSLGVNYWWRRHNANLKAAWGRVDPRVGPAQDQFTVQLQLFYF